MLGRHRLGRAVRRAARPAVRRRRRRARPHRALGAGVPDHDDRPQIFRPAMTRSTSCLMAVVRPLRRAPSHGDERLRVRHLHPLPDRVGGEAAEDDVVRGADPGAGEHRDDDLGDHRQEDPDDVALADAEVLEPVGQPLHVALQLCVGDVALLALLAAPVIGDPVAEPGLDVPVQTVVGGVEPAIGEPRVERRVRVVQHRGERLVPVQLPGLFGPVCLRVTLGASYTPGSRMRAWARNSTGGSKPRCPGAP